jgi:hypothetical protein
MARETKAERQARQLAERQIMENVAAATYPDRLMAMLERAPNANWELSVKENKFILTDRDESWASVFELTLVYSQKNQDTLNELEWRVEAKEAEVREAARRYQVKQTALSKLTQEEKELLGL